MNLRTREYFTIPISNFPAPPANVNTLQVEQNWEERNCIFFCKTVYLSASDIGKKKNGEASIKYSAGKLFHRMFLTEITVLGVLNKGKGLFSKFI